MDEEISSMDESLILGWHPWMEKCHQWMKVSSVDVIHTVVKENIGTLTIGERCFLDFHIIPKVFSYK